MAKNRKEEMKKVEEHLDDVSSFIKASTVASAAQADFESSIELAKRGLQVLRKGYELQIDTSPAPDAVKEQAKVVAFFMVDTYLDLLDIPRAEDFGFGDSVSEVFSLVQATMLSKNNEYLGMFNNLLPVLLKIGNAPVDSETRKQGLQLLAAISTGMNHVVLAADGFRTMIEATDKDLKAASAAAAEAVVRQASEAL